MGSKDGGFTILECILAVGILSSLIGSLIVIQSSIVAIAQNSIDTMKSTWALRQAAAQMDYVLDAGGFPSLKMKGNFSWPGDPKFQVTVEKQDLTEVKVSQFLKTAVKFYHLSDPMGSENLDVDRTLAMAYAILDGSPLASSSSLFENKSLQSDVSQTPFVNVILSVRWMQGSQAKVLEDGFFLMDNFALSSIRIPDFSGNSETESSKGAK
jgi:hypothetical protein